MPLLLVGFARGARGGDWTVPDSRNAAGLLPVVSAAPSALARYASDLSSGAGTPGWW